MTSTEAARRLGVRTDYLGMLLRSGKLAARKKDGRWLVSAEDIEIRLSRKVSRGKPVEKVLHLKSRD